MITDTLILLAVMGVPVALAVLAMFLWRRKQDREGRRSPLVDKLYHGPGEQLRRDIAHHDEEMQLPLTMLLVIGPLMLASMGLTQADWNDVTAWSLVIPAVLTLAISSWAIRRLLKHGELRRRKRQGLDGELMTAQHLLPLMAEGCLVYHDIPAGKFNIDHVVIGPHGVFAVETKSRKKPREAGTNSARVHHDGDSLRFPDHISTRPIQQARHQTRWLAEYLRGAAGEPVGVVPVVALPGWYVVPGKDAHRCDVRVINPKQHKIFLERRSTVLSASLRTRIAHALTQRYPDTE